MSLRTLAPRLRAAVLLAIFAALALAGSTLSDSNKQPDKLVILSTTDVKGKTGPCG